MKQPRWPDAWAPKPNVSLSSIKTFEECRRKYWLLNAPSDIRTKFPHSYKVERNLMSDNMVVGQIVDETIKRGLRIYRGTKMWPSDLIAMGMQTLLELIDFSRAFSKVVENPKSRIPFENWNCLERVYYKEEYSDNELDAKRSEISRCLTNYEESGFRDFLDIHWEYEWDIPQPVTVRAVPWFSREAMPIYASYDFVVRGPGGAFVVDWKTGRRTDQTEDHARRQLHVYAAFVADHYKVPIDKIHIGPVWLKQSGYPEFTDVDPNLIEEILAGWKVQYELVKDLFVEAATAEKLGARIFPKTDDLNKCRNCQFRSCQGHKNWKDSLGSVPVDEEEDNPGN